MCRFVVYRGEAMFMSDLLTRSEQSLIRQSFKAREREEPLNGDGFGVGWYDPAVDPTPCVFTSIRPAWSNRNLHRLAEKIRSGCFFAHVRAASGNLPVSELNCHPFQCGRLLWMHNGAVAGFEQIERRLRGWLEDDYYHRIVGSTDSEHAFAVFLQELGEAADKASVGEIAMAMRATISRLDEWTGAVPINEPSRYNFAVTDGRSLAVTRYVSGTGARPHSLYYAAGREFHSDGSGYHMHPAPGIPTAVIVASEPLTEDRSYWTEVPPNHMVTVDAELGLEVTAI